ncbi:MAG: hypothetical protein AABX37_03465 [Nanoarchaeota archaeon]
MRTTILVGIIAVVVLALVVSGCGSSAPQAPPSGPTPSTSEETGDSGNGLTGGTVAKPSKVRTVNAQPNYISVTAEGFEPSMTTIKRGETVTFTNRHTADTWPASDPYPLHNAYPGSHINKCGTPERDTLFDACARVKMGNSYSFTFYEKGTWKYHDHLHPGNTGTITVE